MPVVCRVLRDGEIRTVPGLPVDPRSLIADPSLRFWLDVDTIDAALLEEMGRRFDFHPLAIEDCHHSAQRPKADEYPGYLFFSFHAVDDAAGGEVRVREIDGFLGANFLVTVHEEPSPEIEALALHCEKDPGVLARGVDHLFHTLIDAMVDTHFPVLDAIEDRLDDAEDRIFDRGDPGVLEDLFRVRKELMAIRRLVGPQRDLLGLLSTGDYPQFGDSTRIYLRNAQDHLIRLTELVEAYRDLVNGAMEAYRSEVSQRLNEVMKYLGVIGTLALPLTLIAGLWGMNFDVIPWAHHPNGFWFVLVLLAVVVAGMLWIFRRIKWL
jgi:magnesium transporter